MKMRDFIKDNQLENRFYFVSGYPVVYDVDVPVRVQPVVGANTDTDRADVAVVKDSLGGDYAGSILARAYNNVFRQHFEDRDFFIPVEGGYDAYGVAFILDRNVSEADAFVIRDLLDDSYIPWEVEEEIARIEEEWIQEGWDSWIHSDLIRDLGEIADEGLVEQIENMDTGALLQYVRVLNAESGIDWIPEHSGIHVDTRELAKTLAENPPEL